MSVFDKAELADALLSEIGDALFLLDPDTDRLLEVNPVALRLTGFSRAEVLQLSATQLLRFEVSGGTQRLRAAMTNAVAFQGQDGCALRTKSDDWLPVSLTVSSLHLTPRPLGLIIARDDRERRAALAQARRVEGELRAVLTRAPVALWSAERAPGPDALAGWQFRCVSPLLAHIVGRPPEYLDHPFKWAEVVHPADRDGYRAALRRTLTLREGFDQVYRVQTAGGAVRWVRDRLQALTDSSGRPVRLDGCVVDVTEQRAAETAVQQSEGRFRALVEKSRDGILLLDSAGAIRYATPATKLILGFAPDEVVGLELFSFVHPDDLAEVRKRFAACLSGPGEDVSGTFRALAAGGSARVVEMNLVNRLNDPSVCAVVVNYRDVTERDAAARELAQQHTLLEGLFASVPDVVCYKDREGRFLGCNPAFEAFSGRPAAAVRGLRCDEVFRDEWAARLHAAEQMVLATGRTERAKQLVRYPDGREALLDVVIAPLRDDAGKPLGLIVVCRDVTEHQRLEEALRQSHKMEAVGRLAGGVAHDFNNLLTVVLGNLELLRCGATGAEAADLLRATERAARQAAELTKQMLGFARSQPLRTIPVELNGLVRDSLDLLRRSIDPRVAVRFSPDPNPRPVAADPVQVQQVVMNLCLNARDAMPDGGTLTVEIAEADPPGAADARHFARLSVSDTGQGMTEGVRAKVFDPFFTTKSLGQGTGLGLAVVYGVAKAHGGRVEVTSTPGAGSRFDVYLPRVAGTDGHVVPAPQSAPAARDFPRGNGETVLVADDEAAVGELARAALEMAGYRVLVATDGAEALDLFRRAAGTVKLAVLDASMPKLTGRQVFESIRRLDPGVKVLFASGYHGGSASDDPPGTQRLNKPYVPSELAGIVHEMLAPDS
ncbi:MAG: PAS domain S-box protein [Gemmata sp.]